MKLSIQISFCLLILLFSQCVFASSSAKVISQGETIVSAKLNKKNVKVKIKTHEVDIGKAGSGAPNIYESETCCTYTRYPCSVVDNIVITVNDKPVFVPRSSFCSLSDLNSAELSFKDEELVLSITGADASEGYYTKIVFDSRRVKRKIVGVLVESNQPPEETTYFEVIIGP